MPGFDRRQHRMAEPCWFEDLRAHGFQILCFTAAGAGSFAHTIGDTLLGFIEQSAKFLKPVFAGDALYPILEIAALTPQRATGIVAVAVYNQRGEQVLTR